MWNSKFMYSVFVAKIIFVFILHKKVFINFLLYGMFLTKNNLVNSHLKLSNTGK